MSARTASPRLPDALRAGTALAFLVLLLRVPFPAGPSSEAGQYVAWRRLAAVLAGMEDADAERAEVISLMAPRPEG